MPWEIKIVSGSLESNQPLGTIEEINAIFAAVLDGVTLQQPPIPPPEILNMMPPIVREAMLRPQLQADYEQDDFSIQFYADSTELELTWVNGEVRGNGNPQRILAALCQPRGWSVVDCTTRSKIDLNDSDCPAWDGFQEYRNGAIEKIKEDED